MEEEGILSPDPETPINFGSTSHDPLLEKSCLVTLEPQSVPETQPHIRTLQSQNSELPTYPKRAKYDVDSSLESEEVSSSDEDESQQQLQPQIRSLQPQTHEDLQKMYQDLMPLQQPQIEPIQPQTSCQPQQSFHVKSLQPKQPQIQEIYKDLMPQQEPPPQIKSLQPQNPQPLQSLQAFSPQVHSIYKDLMPEQPPTILPLQPQNQFSQQVQSVYKDLASPPVHQVYKDLASPPVHQVYPDLAPHSVYKDLASLQPSPQQVYKDLRHCGILKKRSTDEEPRNDSTEVILSPPRATSRHSLTVTPQDPLQQLRSPCEKRVSLIDCERSDVLSPLDRRTSQRNSEERRSPRDKRFSRTATPDRDMMRSCSPVETILEDEEIRGFNNSFQNYGQQHVAQHDSRKLSLNIPSPARRTTHTESRSDSSESPGAVSSTAASPNNQSKRRSRISQSFNNFAKRSSRVSQSGYSPGSISNEGSPVLHQQRRRRSTLSKMADAVSNALAFSKERDDGPQVTGRKKKHWKNKVQMEVLPPVERQISHPMETPSLVITNDSPEEEAVIKPMKQQLFTAPNALMMPAQLAGQRGRRHSLMPGAEPPQLMMRKMSQSKKESSGEDLPKIDDVVFTVNQEGEMEMFEVIQAEVPDHPPGRIEDLRCMQDFTSALLNAKDQLVCVTFSAKWCGPWRSIKPDVHRLSLIHCDVMFYEVDVDVSDDIALARRVACMPTFQFFKCGVMLDQFAEHNRIKLDESIRRLRKMPVKAMYSY